MQPLVGAITKLLPGTDEIILVGGSAPFDRAILNRVRELAEGSFPGRISELSGETPDLIAEKLAQAEPGSVVLFTCYFKDADGTTMIPRRVVEKMSAESAVPVFAHNRTAQLGQISTWIAHEINQPLGSIQNNAETALILLENGEGSYNEVREILTDIKSENRRASGIVRQIRSMLGDIHTSGGPIAVGELLGDVSRSAAPEAARRSVDLVLPDSGSAEGFLFGDRAELRERFETLTATEKRVFQLVVEGLPNKAIASEIGNAERTVKLHRSNLSRKLGTLCVADLVRFYYEAGLE